MSPFLITGLPRSRTAWMAVAACNDQSVCWHEPIGWLDRWQDVFTEIWGKPTPRYIGVSDSALGFHLSEIIARICPKVLIIERDPDEVEASLRGIGPVPRNYCELLTAALGYAHPLIMRVSFHELKYSDVVGRCLLHLMPGAAINLARIEAMLSLNIQADLDRVREITVRRAGDAAEMLGADVVARFEPRRA